MSINYNNVNELLDLMSKFVFESENFAIENYVYKRLDPNNITINQIIKNADFEYQHIINTTSESKPNFKIIEKQTPHCKKIILKKNLSKHTVTMIIQKDEKNLVGTTSIIDIYFELLMNQIISEFIVHDKIPFYLLNICNFNLSYEKLTSNVDFKELILNEYKVFDYTNLNINFCISLYFNEVEEYISLKELLNQELTEKEIAQILFQVFFSHSYLSYKLENFRHNQFTIDSFLIAKYKTEQNYNFILGDLKFKLDKVKYVCKLFNFRDSVFQNFSNNYTCEQNNPSYDVYQFAKSLFDYTKKINKNFDKIKIIISNFIIVSILEENFLTENIFLNKYTESLIPYHILTKNNFFSSFINMDIKNYLKQLESDKKLVGGVIQSLTEDYTENNHNSEHGKKKSKKSKSKKSKSKKSRMSRETLRPRESRKNKDSEDEKRNSRDEEQEEVYEEVDNIDEISPDQENQNDDLLSEGDDDRQKVPTDDTEKGLKKSKRSKKTKKSSKRSSKKMSKKGSKKSSVNKLRREIMNLENEIKYREEKLKLQKNASSNDSTTLSFNFSDSSSVKESKPENSLNSQKMAQLQMLNQPQSQLQNQAQVETKPNIMLPSNELPMVHKQKMGTNNNINALLQELNEDQLIPVLPEMQQMFDINQLELQQQQAYQRGQAPIDDYTGQPQIMDQSIFNMARSGKVPLPFLNNMQMSNPMSMNVPITGNIFEAGFQGIGQNKQAKQPTQQESKLKGGGKNFFLKKKN